MGINRTMIISHSEEEENWLALHAAVGLSTLMVPPTVATYTTAMTCRNTVKITECPKQIFELALNMCPHEAAMCNANSQHPLHLACASGSPYMIRELLVLYPEAAQTRDDHHRFALHWACATTVRRHRSGHTNNRNHDGEPASSDGWIAALELLILANPHALTSPDPMTHLLPFMLAAASISSSNNNPGYDNVAEDMGSLETCYSLLVCQLDVLFPYLTRENVTRNSNVANSMCLASRKHGLDHERTDESSSGRIFDRKNGLRRLGDRAVETIRQFFTRST
eukprot:scaffold547798_cov71-Attheya_sp.AAC.2